jgi:Fe-S-cluster containining protein
VIVPRKSKRARNQERTQLAQLTPSRKRSLPVLNAAGDEPSFRADGNGHGNGKRNGRVNGNDRVNGNGRTNGNGHAATQAAGVPCTSCGLCCTYVVVDIDAPTTLDAASTALWYLYHPGMSLYTADGEWMLQFDTRCKFLGADNRCGIYEQRPRVCRDFDERECEVNSEDVGLSFYEPQPFLDWLALHHKRIHTLLAKRYVPDAARLAGAPADRRPLPPFAGRVRALRASAFPH